MIKNLDKRNKESLSYVTPIKTEKMVEKDDRLTQKEYKTIYHEIKTRYFDLDEMKAIRILSLDEIISCTALFLQLGMNNEQINRIIRIIEKENKKSRIDVITQYNEVSQKLQYYGQNENLLQYIEVLSTTPKEDADYEYWLMEFEQELESVIVNLQDNHEYEIEKAAELIKTNNPSAN